MPPRPQRVPGAGAGPWAPATSENQGAATASWKQELGRTSRRAQFWFLNETRAAPAEVGFRPKRQGGFAGHELLAGSCPLLQLINAIRDGGWRQGLLQGWGLCVWRGCREQRVPRDGAWGPAKPGSAPSPKAAPDPKHPSPCASRGKPKASLPLCVIPPSFALCKEATWTP